MMAHKQTVDVLIVGGGLVGLTAAVALSRLGKSVAVVDAAPLPSETHAASSEHAAWDSRIYALTRQTVQWLTNIGIWTRLPVDRLNPIDAMQLWSPSQAHVSPDLTLAASDANMPDMGCIIESRTLLSACWQALQDADVQCYAGVQPVSLQVEGGQVDLMLDQQVLSAKLLLGADGARSWVRQQCGIATDVVDFQQTALVTNYRAEQPHGNVARQWFGAHETLALLPMPAQQVSLVWALPTADADRWQSAGAEALAAAVAQRANQVLGKLQLAGDVLAFPLRQQTARMTAMPGVLLLGDAAHQVHPMAGQGVNLGFQDVMALCSEMQRLPSLQPIGDLGFLRHVVRSRKSDLLKMQALTRGLDSLFAKPQAAWTHAAVTGLRALQNNAMLKQFLIRTATGSV